MVDPIQLSTPQAVAYAAIINAVIGLVLGLIPLLLGYFYKQLRTGMIGILVATIGGGVIGIFASIPAAIIFTWLIVRNSTPAPADGDSIADAIDESSDILDSDGSDGDSSDGGSSDND